MRWAVLVGGTGSNLAAILARRPAVEVGVVVSHRPGVGALAIADQAGVATEVLTAKGFPDRDAYGEALRAIFRRYGIQAVALAGFLRWLDAGTVAAFRGRVVNLHPSLLPAFPGLNAVRQALDWGVRVTGVTVHFVDEGHDSGPIIWQEAVRVGLDDDEASLTAKIHAVEHRIYPEVIGRLDQGRIRLLEGRRVWLDGPLDDGGEREQGTRTDG